MAKRGLRENLLLRQISEEGFTTYLGNVEYTRTDVLDDLKRVRTWHAALARGRGLNNCGCDYCAVLVFLSPPPEQENVNATS